MSNKYEMHLHYTNGRLKKYLSYFSRAKRRNSINGTRFRNRFIQVGHQYFDMVPWSTF
jgi:hypothetical protein